MGWRKEKEDRQRKKGRKEGKSKRIIKKMIDGGEIMIGNEKGNEKIIKNK